MIKQNSGIETTDQSLFNRIAVNYFKKDLVISSSIARQLRLQQTLKLAGLKKHYKILEVGCGGGFSAKYLTGNYAEYLGIDYSENLIESAKHHFDIPCASFRALNIKDLEPEYKDFDIIFMIGVLHHINEIQQVLRKLKTHLKAGGVLVVNEPKPGNPLITLLRSIRKNIDPAYSKDQKELSVKDLLESFENAGYANIRFYPQGIFSTPFAEVPLPPAFIMTPLSRLACKMDYFMELYFAQYISKMSWNIALTGKNPVATV